jgi:hypothetical protein
MYHGRAPEWLQQRRTLEAGQDVAAVAHQNLQRLVLIQLADDAIVLKVHLPQGSRAT